MRGVHETERELLQNKVWSIGDTEIVSSLVEEGEEKKKLERALEESVMKFEYPLVRLLACSETNCDRLYLPSLK